MTIEVARRYEQISSKAYEHPADRAATSALHSVPLLDTVIKRLTDLGHERQVRQMVQGNAIVIGPDQVPDLWDSYVHCTTIFDVEPVPKLFVTNSPMVNAATVGAKTPIIVIYSSLAGSYEKNEVQTVLAHEVGHVLSEHYYYTTALIMLSSFIQGTMPRSLLLGLPVRAMYFALLEWHRAAELSSDRAAALIMDDPLEPCRVLMRLAGGALPGMNFDAFLAQCNAYENEDDLFSRHSRFWMELNMTHPIPVRRVKELMLWVQSGDYDRIRGGNYARRGQEPPPSSEFNAAVEHYRERFVRLLDRMGDNVQDVGRKLADWLRRTTAESSGADDEDLA
jgi:hypothetical protein